MGENCIYFGKMSGLYQNFDIINIKSNTFASGLVCKRQRQTQDKYVKYTLFIHFMKKTTWMLGAVAILGLTFASCSQDPAEGPEVNGKKGMLMLNLNGKTNFVKTRALNEADYNNVDNYTVVVTDKDGREQLNCKGSEVASRMPLTMSIGSYTVKAFYGEEKAASRDIFYVEGIKTGTIKADQKENIEVVCTPTCGRIVVNFNDEMATYFSDYNVSFTGTEALGSESISWLKDDVEPWYVKLNEGEETISFTITTTTKEEYVNSGNKEQVATKTGTFRLSRNKGYKMNINPSYTPSETGSVDIVITIDESTNDKPVDIEVPVDWI